MSRMLQQALDRIKFIALSAPHRCKHLPQARIPNTNCAKDKKIQTRLRHLNPAGATSETA